MREGDLIFFSGRSLFSRMVRLRTLSAISHVGMLVTINDRLWVAEALEGHGLRVVPLSVWESWDGDILVGHNTMNAARRKLAAEYMLKHIGFEYAAVSQFVRSFSFVWSRLARLFGRKVDRDRKRFTCSEAVSAALHDADYWLPCPAAAMSPHDVSRLPIIRSFTKWPIVCPGE